MIGESAFGGAHVVLHVPAFILRNPVGASDISSRRKPAPTRRRCPPLGTMDSAPVRFILLDEQCAPRIREYVIPSSAPQVLQRDLPRDAHHAGLRLGKRRGASGVRSWRGGGARARRPERGMVRKLPPAWPLQAGTCTPRVATQTGSVPSASASSREAAQRFANLRPNPRRKIRSGFPKDPRSGRCF